MRHYTSEKDVLEDAMWIFHTCSDQESADVTLEAYYDLVKAGEITDEQMVLIMNIAQENGWKV